MEGIGLSSARRCMGAILALLAVVAVACDNDDSAGTADDATPGQATTTEPAATDAADENDQAGDGQAAEVVVWSPYGEAIDTIFQDAAAEYMASHPNVSVSYQSVSGGSEFRDRFLTVAASGQGPDILYLAPEHARVYAAEGLLLPLPEEQFSDAIENSLAPLPTNEEGEPVGVWFGGGFFGFDYRTDFAAEAGWEGPLPTTWDELIEYCTTTVQRDANGNITREGVSWNSYDFPTLPFVWPSLIDGLLRTQGSSLLSEDGTQSNLATPEAAAAVQLIHDMIYVHECSLPASQVLRPPTEGLQPMMVGNSAADWQVTHSPTLYMTQGDDEVRQSWDKVPFVPKPAGGEDIVLVVGSGWAVSSQSEYPDEAFDVLAEFSRVDVLSQMATDPEVAVAVFRSDVMTAPETNAFWEDRAPGAEVFNSSWSDPRLATASTPALSHVNIQQIVDTLGEGIVQALEDPELDIEAWLRNMQAEVDAVLTD